MHAEARMGQAIEMVASSDADHQRPPLIGRSTGQGLYLPVNDVDDVYRKVITSGPISVIEPEDTELGSRSRAPDPQGQELSAGSYEPGSSR
ncbi:hypothetical protein [Arthrobacter sp. NPDC056493]|uniref:hypothetical protein n=1 Tax=Arthrobacter sp. NPDC056493 TaxID=3345839 RepID=UPI00366D8F3B